MPCKKRKATSFEKFVTVLPASLGSRKPPCLTGFSRSLPGQPPAVGFLEDSLPQADRCWRHFDQLIFLDVLERRFQRHVSRRLQKDVFVAAGSADVCEFLFLGWIHGHVLTAAVLADDHAFVNFVPG